MVHVAVGCEATVAYCGSFRFDKGSKFLQQVQSEVCSILQPAIAAMHGTQSVFDIGLCTVIHCDAGGVSLVDQ